VPQNAAIREPARPLRLAARLSLLQGPWSQIWIGLHLQTPVIMTSPPADNNQKVTFRYTIATQESVVLSASSSDADRRHGKGHGQGRGQRDTLHAL